MVGYSVEVEISADQDDDDDDDDGRKKELATEKWGRRDLIL